MFCSRRFHTARRWSSPTPISTDYSFRDDDAIKIIVTINNITDRSKCLGEAYSIIIIMIIIIIIIISRKELACDF
jgi:hypothetical protein